MIEDADARDCWQAMWVLIWSVIFATVGAMLVYIWLSGYLKGLNE